MGDHIGEGEYQERFAEEERPFECSAVWETRDGRRIPITGLESGHLDNIIAMLERGGIASEQMKLVETYLYGVKPNGELAQEAFLKEADRALKDVPIRLVALAHYRPVYRALLRERARRKKELAEVAAGEANLGAMASRATRR